MLGWERTSVKAESSKLSSALHKFTLCACPGEKQYVRCLGFPLPALELHGRRTVAKRRSASTGLLVFGSTLAGVGQGLARLAKATWHVPGQCRNCRIGEGTACTNTLSSKHCRQYDWLRKKRWPTWTICSLPDRIIYSQWGALAGRSLLRMAC